MSKKFVRVKDLETKHEFDVSESDPRIKSGVFKLVKQKTMPPTHSPRAPRHYVQSKGVTQTVAPTDDLPAETDPVSVSPEDSAK